MKKNAKKRKNVRDIYLQIKIIMIYLKQEQIFGRAL